MHISNPKVLKQIEQMPSREAFLEFMTRGRVTVGKVMQVVGDDLVTHYVARIRGVVVASSGTWLHASPEDARQFERQVMARWREELARLKEGKEVSDE